MSKYLAKKTVVDGIKFDSKKESKRYLGLKLLEKGGLISDLERQKRFELVPKQKDERAVHYVADFYYYDREHGYWVAEDVKSSFTRKKPEYIIKRKLFKLRYPDIRFFEFL